MTAPLFLSFPFPACPLSASTALFELKFLQSWRQFTLCHSILLELLSQEPNFVTKRQNSKNYTTVQRMLPKRLTATLLSGFRHRLFFLLAARFLAWPAAI
jgi:hypothetical protein